MIISYRRILGERDYTRVNWDWCIDCGAIQLEQMRLAVGRRWDPFTLIRRRKHDSFRNVEIALLIFALLWVIRSSENLQTAKSMTIRHSKAGMSLKIFPKLFKKEAFWNLIRLYYINPQHARTVVISTSRMFGSYQVSDIYIYIYIYIKYITVYLYNIIQHRDRYTRIQIHTLLLGMLTAIIAVAILCSHNWRTNLIKAIWSANGYSVTLFIIMLRHQRVILQWGEHICSRYP